MKEGNDLKISELNTEDAMNVLCTIVPYIENIVSDEDMIAVFNKRVSKADMQTPAQQYLVTIDIFADMIPVVLKTHRADVLQIVAAVNGMTPAQISKMNWLKTASLIRDTLKDKELIAFFKSCVSGGESG